MATIKKEKALDVVRQMVADGQVSQEVAEKYFPELKESEDKRIRNLLIRFVKYDMPDNYSDDFSKEGAWWAYKEGMQVGYNEAYNSLRNQAAIAAMQGVMNFFGSIDYNREDIAKLAVEQADALIEQLKGK